MVARIIHGQTLSDLRQILEPDVQLVTCPYEPGPRVFNFLAALDLRRLNDPNLPPPKDRLQEQNFLIAERVFWGHPDYGKLVLHAALSKHFPDYPGYKDTAGFAAELEDLTGKIHDTFRPVEMNGFMQLDRHDPNRKEVFHFDENLCTVRALLTFKGRKGTRYRETTNSRIQTLAPMTLSVHKSVEGGSPLRHASSHITKPADNRMLYTMDLHGGDCPSSTRVSRYMRFFRAQQPKL